MLYVLAIARIVVTEISWNDTGNFLTSDSIGSQVNHN